jgi:hypothetical protein
MGRMLVAAILGSVVIGCLAGFGVLTYYDPIGAISILGLIAGFGVAVVCSVYFLEYLNKPKKANPDKPDSLFMQKYKAHKAKICPMVEYD